MTASSIGGSGERADRDRRAESSAADRAQLSMPVVEVAVGVVLVLGVVGLFALGTPSPTAEDPQLEAYAADVATVLEEEPPRHEGTTRLDEVTRSEDAFDREADALERRIDALLPANLLFRVETPHGSVGHERPADAEVGVQVVTTQYGEVRIEVWYP